MRRYFQKAAIGTMWFAMALGAQADAQKLVTPGYLFNSDPTCRQIGERFYLFTTQDPFTVQFQRDNTYFRGMFAYHAFSTTDFDNWVDHGSVLTARDVNWNVGGALWDGDAGIPYKGRYYAYAPFRVNAKGEENYGRFHLGAFVADRLDGPYRDVFGAPMRGPDGKPIEALSPYIITGDDGAPYLLWGSGDTEKHDVWIARLNADMTSLAQAPRQLRVPQRDACGNLEYFESPMLLKTNGRWVLTYVAYKEKKGAGCDVKGSYVRYTSAPTMFGPFDEVAPQTLIYPSPGGQESTQQGMCTYKGEHYLAYHVPYDNVIPYADHHRQVAVTRLQMTPKGKLKPVHPETDTGVGTPGVANLILDAFAARREAAEFHIRTGVTGEAGLSGEYQMKMKPGGYLLFKGMDFKTGARRFRVELSSENPNIRNARLEVRLDNPAGPVVATLKVGPTAGRTVYALASSDLQAPATGVHDLVLMAHGSDGDVNGHLFNITWFAFDPVQPGQ